MPGNINIGIYRTLYPLIQKRISVYRINLLFFLLLYYLDTLKQTKKRCMFSGIVKYYYFFFFGNNAVFDSALFQFIY